MNKLYSYINMWTGSFHFYVYIFEGPIIFLFYVRLILINFWGTNFVHYTILEIKIKVL